MHRTNRQKSCLLNTGKKSLPPGNKVVVFMFSSQHRKLSKESETVILSIFNVDGFS